MPFMIFDVICVSCDEPYITHKAEKRNRQSEKNAWFLESQSYWLNVYAICVYCSL